LRPRILIVVNVEWYFWSHRLPLARGLRDIGCEVIVAAGVERGYESAIEREGFRFISLRLSRRSTNPWHEVTSIWELFNLYRRERPDLVHHITIKPVLYGTLAARAAAIPALINTIPGLGYTFSGAGIRGSLVRTAVSKAYQFALSGRRVRVIFQNPEDRALFCSTRIATPERSVVIRGSGVNIKYFTPSPAPAGTPIVLLAGRLLWDKGVGELVEAARQLKVRGTECRVVLAGIPDAENPRSIPVSVLEDWQAEGVIEWWGQRDDMPAVLEKSSIVVLPSYYPEGVPKILLEAAASGRPIITTNTPGCREVVRHGENGLLIPPRDSHALAEAIAMLLHNPVLREQMGARGRELVVTQFSEEQVIRETLAVYQDLLAERWQQSQSVPL
jgi:glycosyltransferase involved in cell wall biosynthesis